jgi:hypothetical protein
LQYIYCACVSEEKAAAASTIASLQSRIADLNTAAAQQQEQANNQQTVLLAQVSAAEQGVTKEKEAAEARCAAAGALICVVCFDISWLPFTILYFFRARGS